MISRVQSTGQDQSPQAPQVQRAAKLLENTETPQVFPSAPTPMSEASAGGSLGSLVQQPLPTQEPAQHRLLEELLGINRMLETINTASTRTDERFAGCEASSLELKTAFHDMRRDMDGLQSRFLDLSDLIVARET